MEHRLSLFVLMTMLVMSSGGYNLGQRGGARRPVISTGPVEEQSITGEATFFREPTDTQLLVPLEPFPQEPSPPKNPVTPQSAPKPTDRPNSDDNGNDQNLGNDGRGQSNEDRNSIYNYHIGYVGRPHYHPTMTVGSNSEYTWRGYAQEVRRIPVGQTIRPGGYERAPLRPGGFDRAPLRPGGFDRAPLRPDGFERAPLRPANSDYIPPRTSSFDRTPPYQREFDHYPTRRGIYHHEDPTSYRLAPEEDRYHSSYGNRDNLRLVGPRFENLRIDEHPYRQTVARDTAGHGSAYSSYGHH